MKKALHFLLALCMLLGTLSFSNAVAKESYDKFSDELIKAYDAVNSSEQLEVLVWLADDSTEKYCELSSNITEPALYSSAFENNERSLTNAQHKNVQKDIEVLQEYITQKREIARTVYLEENKKLSATLEKKLQHGKIQYVSQYSPLLVCSLSQSEALDFAESKNVTKITYANIETRENMSDSKATMGINDIPSSSFSAEGIKIGMVELAVPDITCPALSQHLQKITIIGNANTHTHATSVATILMQTVPDCERLYCIATEGAASIIEKTEILLTRGVNVINYSMGLFVTYDGRNNVTTYNEYSEWFDHIAYNHSVHCVIGSGNIDENGNPAVSCIAMAYNVITVGNIDNQNTPHTSDDVLASTSSYNGSLTYEYPFKPDLCAPGERTYVAPYPDMTEFSGTSSATPKVAAVVAALCSYRPALLTKQALMKSILMSSVSVTTPKKYDTTLLPTGFVRSGYKMYGSGIINAYNAIQLIDDQTYRTGSITASESEDIISIGELTAGQTVTITLSFLKRSRFPGTEHTSLDANLSTNDLADLDLFVCAAPLYIANSCSKTSSHKKSVTTNNNSETLIFTATTNDHFLICIDKAAGQDPYEIIYAVSWFIQDNNSH